MQPATYLDHASRIERLVAELRSDLTRSVSLGEMGEIAAMSPFHLNRVVREITGLPPVALHGAFRLQEAKRLLLTTDASVTDACFEVGFSSLGSFSSRFTLQVGATPSDFKRSPLVVDGYVDQLVSMIDRRPHLTLLRGVSGEIVGEGIDDGLIFIGVYPSAVARGFPVCGEVLRRPGPFFIPHVPDGTWVALVACVVPTGSAIDWVMPDNEPWVGASAPITVVEGHATSEVVIRLRRRSPIESPVLLAPLATPHILGVVRGRLAQMAAAG